MSIVQLSRAERERFALWLETEFASNVGLMEQSQKLSGPAGAMLRRVLQEKNAAYLLVAHDLRSIQEQSVG